MPATGEKAARFFSRSQIQGTWGISLGVRQGDGDLLLDNANAQFRLVSQVGFLCAHQNEQLSIIMNRYSA